MIALDAYKKVWAILSSRERRNGWLTLVFVIVSAFSSALMVGSVLPFLSVLSDPSKIEKNEALSWAYEAFGFSNDYMFLVALGAASFFIIVVASLIQIIRAYVVARFSMMRIHSISYRLLIAYISQPYPFFLSRHSGEMATRVLAETQQLVLQFLRPAAEFVAAAFTVMAIVGLLVWVDALTAFVAFGVLGSVYLLVYAVSRRALKRYGFERAEANAARFRIANEVLGGIKDIKLLGREGAYASLFAEPSRKMARALVVVQLLSQVPQLALQAVAFGGVILLCLVLMDRNMLAADAALNSVLPTLGVFAFAGQRLMPELSRLYSSLAQLQAGSAAVAVVHEDLIRKSFGSDIFKELPQSLGLSRRLELVDVSYRYPGSDHNSLSNISLQIDAGERIGIVGTTGSGKTTLADIFLGLLPPISGNIIADGIFVEGDNLSAWQQSVGYVPQDIFLVDASILENIALGVPPHQIDIHRVQRAAKIAQIDTFVTTELSEGYDTAVGERGVRLSGGQRQRIGIARALYHDADLIVFDESTSALDNLTEREVMAAIDDLPGNKTVVMIAHRLSTVKSCDRIIVLDKGRLVGCDNWESLMRDSEAFRKIADLETSAQ